MTYSPYWSYNALPTAEPPDSMISTYGAHTSSYSSYVASPALYMERSAAGNVAVSNTSPGYITTSPIAIYNPLVSIVEPIVSPSNTILITPPELPEYSRGKKPPKPRPTPQYCDICKVTCATKASVYSHFSGSTHKRKVAQLSRDKESSNSSDSFKCEMCAVSCTSSDSFLSHLNGARHQKKKGDCEKQGQHVDSNLLPKSNVIGDQFIEKMNTAKGVAFKCTLCNCEFSDSNSCTLHLKGRKHRLAYKQNHDPTMFVEMQPSKRLKSCLLAAKKRIARKESKTSRFDNDFKVYTLVVLIITN